VIDVGVDRSSSEILQDIDTQALPRVEVWPEPGSEVEDSASVYVSSVTAYTVAATAMIPNGRPGQSTAIAQWIATRAAELLEQYLVDPSASDTSPIWRCTMVDPCSEIPTSMAGQDAGAWRCYAAIEVATQATRDVRWAYSPQVIQSAGRQRDPIATTIGIATDTTPAITTAPALRATTIDVPAAALAGATACLLDFATSGPWSESSAWAVARSRVNVSTAGTLTVLDQVASVDIATDAPADGDVWTVTVQDSSTLTMLVWSLTWHVTS
jgi:hypothetical protein